MEPHVVLAPEVSPLPPCPLRPHAASLPLSLTPSGSRRIILSYDWCDQNDPNKRAGRVGGPLGARRSSTYIAGTSYPSWSMLERETDTVADS